MLLFALSVITAAALVPGTKVAVVGSTGRVGRLAVQSLVSNGYSAKILTRHPIDATAAEEPAADAPAAAVASWLAAQPGVETVAGDVTDRASLDTLLEGCSAVLALHGARRQRKLSDPRTLR